MTRILRVRSICATKFTLSVPHLLHHSRRRHKFAPIRVFTLTLYVISSHEKFASRPVWTYSKRASVSRDHNLLAHDYVGYDELSCISFRMYTYKLEMRTAWKCIYCFTDTENKSLLILSKCTYCASFRLKCPMLYCSLLVKYGFKGKIKHVLQVWLKELSVGKWSNKTSTI